MAGVPAVEDEPTTGALIQRSGEFSGSLLEPRPDVEFPGPLNQRACRRFVLDSPKNM
jgi:hypothetical protein